jgi:Protein of unknown function (DUF2785)
MLTESELKRQLQGIAANDYHVPDNVDYWQMTQDMLANIGVIDPELRDELILTTVSKWARADRYTPDQYRTILTTMLDQRHLFLGLGERDTDTVFTRAFSILVGGIAIFIHRQRPFLSPTEVRKTLDIVLDYFAQENDLRGFVEGKGWAHAVAHTADLLDELALCTEIDRPGLRRILDAIHAKAAAAGTVYAAEEDERLAYATLSLLSRGLIDHSVVEAWVKSFAPIERVGDWRQRHLNTKHFLRSLYFQAKYRHIAEWISTSIDETLYAITRFK